MQNNPFWDFYTVAAAITLAVLVIGFAVIRWIETRVLPEHAKHLHSFAKQVARFRWYVQMVEVKGKYGVHIHLASQSMPREELCTFFRASHPDAKAAAALERLEVIGLEALEKPLSNQLPFEITAHLRLVLPE